MAKDTATLKPAEELVRQTTAHQPNESAEYRTARNALLVEEIELRRQVARVAVLRRDLPPGGEVKGDYQFLGESSSVQGANPIGFADLFGGEDTLFVYNWMYGPKRARPCPMCTALLARWRTGSERLTIACNLGSEPVATTLPSGSCVWGSPAVQLPAATTMAWIESL